MNDSTFVRHVPCDNCGSSDAGALYTDGHIYCHICGHHTGRRKEVPLADMTKSPTPLLDGLTFRDLPKRRLTEETCRTWGYGIGDAGGVVQVAQYKDDDGAVVAQKLRTPDKDFRWKGRPNKAGLYGRWLWRDAGKMVVITEGEIDAMSVSQVQSHKWPVVSVPNGAPAAAKAVRSAVEWLERFEKVIFMFDTDKEGTAAAKECAALLSPGKAFIASLPLKDANEMLVAGRGSEIVNAIWGAKQFRPDGVVAGTDIWEKVVNDDLSLSIPYPWECWNRKTRGCRGGEMVMITAGTGVGKSEVTRNIVSHFHDFHNETIGYVALEESVRRTATGLMGLKLGKRIHLENSEAIRELKGTFDETVGSGRYFLYDHFGSLDSDTLLSKIRFMVVACGCGTVVLDHVSIVVSGMEIDDERKATDVLMTKLRSLVQELGFRLLVICHLRRVEGVNHEEGDPISLNHLRNSGSLAQLSDIVVALERNQQSPTRAMFTRVRVLKNRPIGLLGVAGWLRYNEETGRLEEQEPPKEQEQDENENRDF